MKIQILSDTHGFDYNISPEVDLVVHAGDFSNSLRGCMEFVKKCNEANKEHVFVLGNHDYYSTNIYATLDFFKQNPKYNLLSYDNTFKFKGFTFVGGTLFTNFRQNTYSFDNQDAFEYNKYFAERGIYDFIAILSKNNKFIKAEEYVTLFNKTLNNIDQYRNKENVVVLTHFPPHLSCIDPQYEGSMLNPYFINDLNVSGFKLWISGHTHHSMDETVDGCRLVINPLGYPNEHGINGFQKQLVLNLKDIYK